MVQRFQSYLRPARRRWGFTQREVAFLIGHKTGKTISRIEALKQTPTLHEALSCAIIFNTAPIKLFPSALAEAERLVAARASELYEEVQGDPSKTARLKLDFLEELLSRLEHNRDARL
jgi:DNA-binding XRE family transcriptional regulator